MSPADLTQRLLTVCCLPLALLTETAAHASAGSAGPNILLILSDDQGWGDLSLHGNSNVRTPQLDALAHSGTRFDRFYVSPVCAPTRASLLTGRYAARTGVRGVTRGAERMNLDEVTIADLLRKAGYATGAFGKWHNGSQYPYHPNGRGFDEFWGFCCGHWGHYFDPRLEHNGQPVKTSGFIADVLADQALAFMASCRTRPFLCFVAFNTPHSPFQVPDASYEPLRRRELRLRYRAPERELLDVTRAALALCENLDDNVGRLLAGLEKLALADRTIVVYLSDNGPNSWRWNNRMKGRKGSVDEGGVRVPCLVRWPGHVVAGQRVDRIAADIDLLPTLLDLAELPVETPRPIDGISLRPLLAGEANEWPERLLFQKHRDRISVRNQRFRADAAALFDIQSDPGQTENLSGTHPGMHRRLVEAIERFRREVVPPAADDVRPFPVGHREFPRTFLPAQDCRIVGPELSWSSRHANASWLRGWTDTRAFPEWDVEIETACAYQVTLHYTCAAPDVGAELELRWGDRQLRGHVHRPFDPPLIAHRDRVPRQESYAKPFAELALGVVRLPSGRGPLQLRAHSKPGREVLQLRGLQLELLADE